MQYEHKMSPFLWLRFEQGDSINGAPDHWRPPIHTLENWVIVCVVWHHTQGGNTTNKMTSPVRMFIGTFKFRMYSPVV